ncbi:uncharacterized protein LOC144924920 [Branchiostoma floridae x Branchiostoma belcheri]
MAKGMGKDVQFTRRLPQFTLGILFLSIQMVLALCTTTQGCPCTIVNQTADCFLTGLTQVPSNLPQDLIKLDLSDNDIRTLRNNSFSYLHLLEVLNLEANQLSVIEPAAFYNLSNLKMMLLTDNRLSYLPAGLFASLPTLQKLDLSKNSLRFILQADIWKGLNLQKLDISYNQLVSGRFSSDFATMPSLHELILSGNNISSLNYSDFHPFLLHEFDLLDFSDNPIIHIDKSFFTLFSAIHILDISGLPIQFSNLQEALEGLSGCNITELRLENYDIPVIRAGSFACLQNTSLKTLTLQHANITEIQDNGFLGLYNLQDLNLAENGLTELPGLAFHGLSRLQFLDLSSVPMTHIPKAALSEVSKTLREINMSPTGIEIIQKGDFNNLTNLKFLYLIWGFSELEIEPFGFRGLQNLEILQLDETDLTNLADNTFAGLDKLTILTLRECNIKSVSSRTFVNLTSLKVLDLYGNDLVQLPQLFSDFRSLEVLNIANNHLSPYDKIDFTNLVSIKHIDLSYNQLFLQENTLNYPAYTTIKTLDLSYNKLFALPFPCFGPCTFFKKLQNLKELNLSGNKLSLQESRGVIFHGLISLTTLIMRETGEIWTSFSNNSILHGMPNLEVIDLSTSYITYIPAELFKVHNKLRSVDLSSNTITHLPQTLFTANSKLRSLFLSWNRITVLNESTFDTILPGLENLAINDNPFFCDCEIEWFISWSEDHPSVVQGWTDGRYQCNTPPYLHGTDLQNFHPDCASHRELYACAITTSFLFLYMLTAVLVNFCSGYFAYMWFRLRLRLRGYEEIRDQPQEFRYDAFVAHSSKDEAWVSRVLSPMLEGRRPRYRLCIGERDFVGGVPILHNIRDAVETSRKTVCIITRSFLRSNWCNYELQMSQGRHHLFDPRRVSLILVFLENIPDRVLQRYPLLNNIVNRDTYLRWPNNQQHLPLFWARLRQALGEPLGNELQEDEDIAEDVV